LLRKWRIAAPALLGFFLLAQFLWQLDHRGSSRSTAAAHTAALIEQRYPERDLLVQPPEVFVRLPENPHWLFYPMPGTSELIPSDLLTLDGEERCFSVVRKVEQKDEERYGDKIERLSGGYAVLPPADCTGP
jgi:hypothetical protein